MKNKTDQWDAKQSEYLLAYDRRRILDCADTFSSLASVFQQMKTAEAEQDRERCLQEENARENRQNLAVQMRQLAGLMQDVAKANVHMIRLGGKQERQIVRAMAGEGLVVSDIYLLRGKEGKLELSLLTATRKEKTVTAAEIAGYLSVLLDIRLTPQKRNPYFIGTEPVNLYFEEEAVFCCMTGAATAVKEGERISGDSFSFYEQDNGLTILLSDGVGSGEDAAADSSQVVDLAEQILDAGLSGSMTGQLLNSLIHAKEQETHMSTLDLCHIDLQKGLAQFVKAGGICSFIKHKDGVERIEGSALPLGFVKGEAISETSRLLEDGDMIILLSDGVLQDWPGEDCFLDLQDQIERIQTGSVQDMANRLLKYAIEQCRGQIRDDMTILAAGIWKNEQKEKME